MFPNQFYMPTRSLMPLARKAVNWGNILSNTQKTLNIVNQAIPVFYQMKPIVNNARTIFKVANEFNKNTNNNVNNNYQNNNMNNYNDYSNDYNNENGPSFFI